MGTEGSHAALVVPWKDKSSAESRGWSQTREGAPLGMAHTLVLTDTLLPLQEPVTVTKRHHIPVTGQHGGKPKRSREFAVSRASRVQAASGKAKMSSQYPGSTENVRGQRPYCSSLIRPPFFHKRWGWRTPATWGEGTLATSSFSRASPDAPAVHSYLLQRAACCPCCGGTL